MSDVEVGENIYAITKTAKKYTQNIYVAVVCVIQMEWIFLIHVKKYMGYEFAGVENLPWETFLSRLFFGK